MVIRRLASLFKHTQGSGLASQLIRGGIGSIIIRVSNVLLGLTLAVVLARSLGPDGYGIYAYVFTLVTIVAIPMQLGLPRLVVRETARAQLQENWGLIRGIWRWATAIIVLLSLALVGLGFTAAWVWGEHFSDLQLTTFYWGLALIPLIALGNLRGAALEGLRRVVLGQLPENVLRPAFLLMLLFAFFWFTSDELTADQAMGLHVVAASAAFVIGGIFLYNSRPLQLRSCPASSYETNSWLRAAWPLALSAGMTQINNYTDIVMLGIYLTSAEVGVYRVAVQGAMFVLFGLQIVAMFVSPYFARFQSQGDLERLQRIAIIGARVSMLVALPTWLILYAYGDTLITIFFGSEFSEGYSSMVILGVGQVVSAFVGPVGVLLNMTGQERKVAQVLAFGAAANVILNIFLISYFGLIGAAVATSATIVISNIFLWKTAFKELGIVTSAFQFTFKKINAG